MAAPLFKGKSAKAQKMLGMNTVEILKSACAQGGRQNYPDWEQFWSVVTTPDNAVAFLHHVLTQYSANSEASSLPDSVASQETILSTILYIALFIRYPTKDVSLNKALQLFKENGRIYPLAKEVFRILNLSSQLNGRPEKELREALDEMDKQALTQCAILCYTPDELRRMAEGNSFTCFVDKEVRGVESALYWPYLLGRLRESPRLASRFLAQLAGQASSLVQTVRANARLAQFHMVQTFHMVRTIMELGPITDRALLEVLIKNVAGCYTWAQPYGGMAADLLERLTEERDAPGSAMIRAFRAERRTAQAQGFDDDLDQAARPVYVFSDPEEKHARVYSITLGLLSRDSYHPQTTRSGDLSASTMVLAVADLLRNFDRAGALPPGAEAGLRLVDAEQAQNLWKEVTSLIAPEGGRPASAAAAESATSALAAIRARLPSLTTAPTWTPVLKPGAGPLPEARFPPLLYVGVDAKGIHEFPSREQLKLACQTVTEYPTTPAGEALQDMLSNQYRCSDANPVDLRCVVAGGDGMLHNFVCAYSLVQTMPELLRGVNLRVYLVPTSRCLLAGFIARHDSWYHRHIFQPFRAQVPLLPWLADSEALKDSASPFGSGGPGGVGGGGGGGGGGLMPPSGADPDPANVSPLTSLFRSLLDSYIRDSTHIYRVQLWEILAWRTKGAGGNPDEPEPDVRVPFAQRFEIGLVTEAKEHLRRNNMPEYEGDVVALTHSKEFNFVPPDIKISFTRVNMHGHALETVAEEGLPVSYLQLSSVPKRGDTCTPPVPAQQWLEMTVRINETARNRARTRRPMLQTDPKQHVNNVVVEATNPDVPFLIRIDNFMNLGPFLRVEIKMMARPNGDPVTLPIQTFAPIDA